MSVHHKAAEKLNRQNQKPSTFYDSDTPDTSSNPVFQSFEQQLELFVTAVKRKSTKRRGQNANAENISSKQ